MKFKSLFIALLLALPVMQLYSQKPWTLSDCIDYAYANNIQIKRTQLQADVARVNLLQSKTNVLPDINAGYNRSISSYAVDPFSNTFLPDKSTIDNYSINSRMSLFNGLQNYNNIKSKYFASMAAMQDVDKEKAEITFTIASAYLSILFQQELVQVSESQKEVTRLQTERTKKLVDAGSIAQGDLLEIQAQLANESLNVVNARNELKLSVLNLTQLLDLDSASGFAIVTPDTINLETMFALPSVTNVYNEALGFFPHIKSAEYQLKSDESALKVQRGRISPQIYLSGGLSTGYSNQSFLYDVNNNPIDYPYSDQFKDNFSKSINIGLSVPIFNRLEVMNGISNARIRVEDSKYMLDQVKQQLYKSIQQAYNDALSAEEKYNSAKEAVNSYKESFHYTEQKYNVGIVNSVEYSIAKNNFIKAESDLLQAKYQYIFSVKILDIYRGEKISL
jgi:outer membrane protein